jgi:hypothetical protein
LREIQEREAKLLRNNRLQSVRWVCVDPLAALKSAKERSTVETMVDYDIMMTHAQFALEQHAADIFSSKSR